jgi:uncharacterized membrane protein YgcG
MVIGGAVVGGVVLTAFITHRAIKASKLRREKAEHDAYERGVAKARSEMPDVMKSAPDKITLDASIPKVGGQQARVVGAVQSAPPNTPTYTTSQGQTYFVQSNPSSGLLETILIMDMLSGPYYYPGCYNYGLAPMYSPFMYGPGNEVIINETIVDSNHSWQTDSAAWSDPVAYDTNTGSIVSNNVNDGGNWGTTPDTPSNVNDNGTSGGGWSGGGFDSGSDNSGTNNFDPPADSGGGFDSGGGGW